MSPIVVERSVVGQKLMSEVCDPSGQVTSAGSAGH